MTDGASPVAAVRPGERSGMAAALGRTVAVVFARPAAWPLALAAFLLRGGILLFVLPFVVLPSPTGLATIFEPMLWRLWIGRPDATVGIILGALVLAFLAWLLIGGLLAAACEVASLRWGASDLTGGDGTEAPRSSTSWAAPQRATIFRVLAVRLLAFIPFAIVLLWSLPGIVAATYAELQVPSDVTVPLVERVAPEVAVPLAAIGLGFILGEILGAIAARSVALGGSGILGAAASTARFMVRSPLHAVLAWLLGAICLAVMVLPALATTSIVWNGVMRTLPDAASVIPAVGAVILLVATWAAALLLAAVASGWRSVWWTDAWLRSRSIPAGSDELGLTRSGKGRGAG
jgi:hypothetical protein